MNRRVIAIDGLAGSGKTTLAKLLAERLDYVHLNTGALYRAAGFLSTTAQVDPMDASKLAALLKSHALTLDFGLDGNVEVRLDSHVLGPELFSSEASRIASLVAAHPEVRTALFPVQRAAFPGRDLVVEGRDMGTVVFPDADLKFFVEVSAEERSLRRMRQLTEGKPLNPEQLEEERLRVLEEIRERDLRDIERAVAPTIAAKDAVSIQNYGHSLTDVVGTMYALAANRCLTGRLSTK